MPIELLFGIVFALVLVVSGGSTRRYRNGYSNAARHRTFGQVPDNEVIDKDIPDVPTPRNGTTATEKSYETCTSTACILQELTVRAESEDGKTASEYRQLHCCDTYDTLSELGRASANLSAQGKEINRLHVLYKHVYKEIGTLLTIEKEQHITSPLKTSNTFLNLHGSTPLISVKGRSESSSDWNCSSRRTLTNRAENLRLTMNPTADPCKDFYEYACGGWTAFWESYIPSGNIDADKFKVPDALLNLHKRNLLGEEIKPTDIEPIKSAKMFYKSCIHAESQKSSPALHVVKKILDQSGGWPMAMEQRDSADIKWQHINNDFIRAYDIDSMYKISLYVPYKMDDEPSICISEPSTSLTVFQVDSKKHSNERQKEIADAATFFAKLDDRNVSRKQIERDAAEIVQFEKKIFKIMTCSSKASYDSEMSVDELQRVYDEFRSNHYNSKINWLMTIQKCFIGTEIKVDGNTTINMTKKFSKYLRKLAKLLDETPPRTVVNYVYWRMISEVGKKVNQYVTDMPAEASDRWYYCVRRHPMTHAIWYAFASTNYVSKEVASATHDLVTSVRKQVAQKISDTRWMDESMKQAAMKKLLTMGKYIGFDDFDINEAAVIGYYEGLVLTEDYEQNILSWIEWMRTKDVERSILSIAIEKRIYPVELNAFYISLTNSIYIPAWIMKFSVIGPEAPESVSLGTLGFVIGHEISHAFDGKGIYFDENGDRVDLPRKVEETYTKKSLCFIDQYDNYPVPELSSTKPIYVNGSATLSENIADAAGLAASFAVLSENMKKKDFKDLRLPGLENLTAEQLFFVSYGNLWCAQMTNTTLARLNANDVHTTRHMRVNGAVSNSEEFDDAFNCPVGSKMNPKKKCNIWN